MTNAYIDIKVSDVTKAHLFYQALGFDHIATYDTDLSRVFKVLPNLFIMVYQEGALDHHGMIPGVDLKGFGQSSLSLSFDDIAPMLAFVDKAVKAGGVAYGAPKETPIMTGYGFRDPDGNVWDVFCFHQ